MTIDPNYLNEVFHWAAESNRILRKDYRKLKQSFRKIRKTWNKLPEPTEKCNNINTLKHNLKKSK